MREDRFIKKYSSGWLELESALKEKKLPRKAGAFSRLSRMDALYNQAVRNLSYAKTHFPSSETTVFLNNLVARAHNRIYREPPAAAGVLRFYGSGLPALLRKTMPFTALAALFFIGAGLFAFLFVMYDADNAAAFLPSEYLENLNYEGASSWDAAVVSSYIMTNNLRVCILSFGLGITLGIGTAYVLIQNGMLVGALAALFLRAGRGLTFWSLILPHGVIELMAIFISGGAAFMIGYAVMRPGIYRRVDSLVIGARRAVRLLGAVVPMLVIAGFIEGYFTPSAFPEWLKLSFAGLTAVLFAGYCLVGIGGKTGNEKSLEKAGKTVFSGEGNEAG